MDTGIIKRYDKLKKKGYSNERIKQFFKNKFDLDLDTFSVNREMYQSGTPEFEMASRMADADYETLIIAWKMDLQPPSPAKGAQAAQGVAQGAQQGVAQGGRVSFR